MQNGRNHIFVFGDFELDTAERQLKRGGNLVPLTPKAFDTLVLLIQNGGRLVRKEDLLKQIWADAIVEEANLARHVWMLRKALGDSDEDAFIETVPKVGYRFVAKVTESGTAKQQELAPAGIPVSPSSPPPSVQRETSPRRSLVVVVVLAVLVLGSVGVVRWSRAGQPSPPAPTGLTLLTDGTHDDLAGYWTNDGRVSFSRAISSTRVESWTMNGDGTGLRRANGQIPTLLTGRWSPDGRKVVFWKENGGPATFLANADGTGEIALPFKAGNLDWSPDGATFVYQARDATDAALYLYTLATGDSLYLTRGLSGADPSFSRDGKQIAFTSWRDGNVEIYVMDADGSNVRRITNHPAFDNYAVFSPDGTQIAFQSNREDEHIEVYLKNLHDDSPPRRLTKSAGQSGLMPKCWSADGTRMLVYTTNEKGHEQIAILAVDPWPARVLWTDEQADLASPQLASDGQRLLYEARLPDQSIELRVTEIQTKRTAVLHRTERGYALNVRLTPTWSPDNTSIAFSEKTGGNSDIFVVKPDGTGLRKVTNNPLLDTSPVFLSATEIAFVRDAYGTAQMYRVNLADGAERRLTGKAGYEMSPALSPDTFHLAFAGDRELRGADIYLLDIRHPNDEMRLAARPMQDTSPSFSPDGKRLAFVALGDGNSEIYLMNADGTGLFRATRTLADESGPVFSRDGRSIIFSSNRSGRFALYQMDVQ